MQTNPQQHRHTDASNHTGEPLLQRMQFLPLGSVIQVKDCPNRMMIVGRMQREVGTGRLFEYSAVLWPEGLVSSSKVYLVAHRAIERVYFVGLQDEREFEFRALIEDTWSSLLADAAVKAADETESDEEEIRDDSPYLQ